MFDIREHGGAFAGQKTIKTNSLSLQINKQTSGGASGSYPRFACAKNTIYLRRNNPYIETIDKLTGDTILLSTNYQYDLTSIRADEHDDYLYGFMYNRNISAYSFNCMNRLGEIVWTTNSISSFNFCLTKNYVIGIGTGGFLYKVDRLTGSLIHSTSQAIGNNQTVSTTSEDDSTLIWVSKANSDPSGNVLYYIDIETMTIKSQHAFYGSGTYNYPYAVAEQDGVLFYVTYSSQDYSKTLYVYKTNQMDYSSYTKAITYFTPPFNTFGGNTGAGVYIYGSLKNTVYILGNNSATLFRLEYENIPSITMSNMTNGTYSFNKKYAIRIDGKGYISIYNVKN